MKRRVAKKLGRTVSGTQRPQSPTMRYLDDLTRRAVELCFAPPTPFRLDLPIILVRDDKSDSFRDGLALYEEARRSRPDIVVCIGDGGHGPDFVFGPDGVKFGFGTDPRPTVPGTMGHVFKMHMIPDVHVGGPRRDFIKMSDMVCKTATADMNQLSSSPDSYKCVSPLRDTVADITSRDWWTGTKRSEVVR